MNFSNYADFRNKVQVQFDGDDISTSDLSVDVLDTIIGAGEQRIYRDLRSSTQDAPLSLTITSNVATLPADFLELRGAPYVAKWGVAIYAPWEALQNQIQLGANTAPNPVYYTFEGDTMIFYPALATGIVVTGRYYKRFADISTGLNALFTRHSDVFLYASLAASAPFLGELTRLPIWEQTYTGLVQAANEQERRRVTRGSKLQTRVA
jgi:hypothetical protein